MIKLQQVPSPPRLDLSDEQSQAVEQIREWWKSKRFLQGNPEIRLGGLAGTGKTTLANALPELLEISRHDVAYCAYTGKAASRLSGGCTIHRLMYKPRGFHCDLCPQKTDPTSNCHGHHCPGCGVQFERIYGLDYGLVIVDEASMVDHRIYEHLMSFGVSVIWIGDHGQLPPVKGSFNLMSDPTIRLETIHRQAADSPILKLAMMARKTGRVPWGNHGPGVRKIGKNTLSHDHKMNLLRDSDLILCGRNKTRVLLNHWARLARGIPTSKGPQVGDRLVCLRNDYEVGVYNGNTATVISVEDAGDAWSLEITLDGQPEAREIEPLKEQFGASTTLREAPRGAHLWDYGYCLTVHKAQGSEAEKVMLMEEPVGTRPRWLYTGITRAKSALTIIGS